MSKLNHPLIAELLEVYIDPNFVYFVSPFYPGGELSDLLTLEDQSQKDKFGTKPLAENEAK